MREAKKSHPDLISIPADETIKLVFGADRKALIQFINSVFSKTYNADTAFLSISNANFVNSETFDQIIGDFIFSIDCDFYHIEFQTEFDKTMTFRIFSYGMAKAKEMAMTGAPDDPLVFIFPQPLVIYLEDNKNISAELTAHLKVADKQPIEFKIPILKIWKWSLEDLTKKEWYLLIPFTLIAYRKKFERVSDMIKHKDEFINAFRSLMQLISQLSADGKISRNLEVILYGAVKNLAFYFNARYINDDEFGMEVKTTLEGTFRTVLDDMRDEARKEGREEGREEERQKAELEKAVLSQEAEAAKKEAAVLTQEAEAAKKEAAVISQQAESAKKEAEAAKEAMRREEQRKALSIRNLKKLKMSNDEIAAILCLPLENVEQVS